MMRLRNTGLHYRQFESAFNLDFMHFNTKPQVICKEICKRNIPVPKRNTSNLGSANCSPFRYVSYEVLLKATGCEFPYRFMYTGDHAYKQNKKLPLMEQMISPPA
jgi:hypothetical protein